MTTISFKQDECNTMTCRSCWARVAARALLFLLCHQELLGQGSSFGQGGGQHQLHPYVQGSFLQGRPIRSIIIVMLIEFLQTPALHLTPQRATFPFLGRFLCRMPPGLAVVMVITGVFIQAPSFNNNRKVDAARDHFPEGIGDSCGASV